ncbi:unnamed protein product [Caenorhabditis sp. 36 PRJEB53466]|nr:unnamed protein product [Caenorhabditis sp. 36 PRJEB53466]
MPNQPQPRKPTRGRTAPRFMELSEKVDFTVCGWILTIFSYVLAVLTLPVSIFLCVKVAQEYERAVIFRLGRVINIEDAARSTKLLAQTTLRNILGTKTLTEMLSDRDVISLQMQATLDETTIPWGVKVERVEMKDVRLPYQLQRVMAAEAEATRDAMAKIIAAEGEQNASRALAEAADVISTSPCAIQLRYLQTLNSISSEKNNTIVFPFPMEMMSRFIKGKKKNVMNRISALKYS